MPISAKAALKRDGGKPDASTWTITELAYKEKVSTKTVQMWILKGKLKDSAKKDADGIWRISKAKFKRPPGLVEQVKLNAAARKKGKAAVVKSAPKKKVVSPKKSATKKTASAPVKKAPKKKVMPPTPLKK